MELAFVYAMEGLIAFHLLACHHITTWQSYERVAADKLQYCQPRTNGMK